MSRYKYGKSNPALRPPVRTITVTDSAGRVMEHDTADDLHVDTADMRSPVMCMCGLVYDLAAVTVEKRYADCSVWTTPCCYTEVDDRPTPPGVPAAFHRIPKDQLV